MLKSWNVWVILCYDSVFRWCRGSKQRSGYLGGTHALGGGELVVVIYRVYLYMMFTCDTGRVFLYIFVKQDVSLHSCDTRCLFTYLWYKMSIHIVAIRGSRYIVAGCPFSNQVKPINILNQEKHEKYGIFKASALWADVFYKSKCLSVCRSVRPSVCVFTFEVPLKHLFAPTSRSRMSHTFRYSESLGKSNGKKWSQIWTFLFENCLKLRVIFFIFFYYFFFGWFCLTKHGGNHASRWIRDLWSRGALLILAYL